MLALADMIACRRRDAERCLRLGRDRRRPHLQDIAAALLAEEEQHIVRPHELLRPRR
jgi:hypothetical protein